MTEASVCGWCNETEPYSKDAPHACNPLEHGWEAVQGTNFLRRKK